MPGDFGERHVSEDPDERTGKVFLYLNVAVNEFSQTLFQRESFIPMSLK